MTKDGELPKIFGESAAASSWSDVVSIEFSSEACGLSVGKLGGEVCICAELRFLRERFRGSFAAVEGCEERTLSSWVGVT